MPIGRMWPCTLSIGAGWKTLARAMSLWPWSIRFWPASSGSSPIPGCSGIRLLLPAALAFAAALRSSPATIAVQPGERTWPIFHELVTRTGAKGNAIPDAYLAAIAIDLGATFFTADRGIARFEGLRWQHPLD